MKALFPVLSVLLLAGCATGAASSGSAIQTAAPTSSAVETEETAEAAATPAPAVNVPQGLEPTGAAVLDYDDIRLIAYAREFQTYPDTDY